MLAHIAADGAALREAAAGRLDVDVTACPGWTVADAVEHTGMVYAHKATIIEGDLAEPPSSWPPAGLATGDVLDFFDEQLHRVIEALRTRDPATTVWTWFEPDQTVGFWVRRMMQETVVHRADVESAARISTTIDDEVGVDGIDEFVERMLCYDVQAYVEDAPGSGERIAIDAGSTGWTVTLAPEAATFERHVADDADATIGGRPGDLLLALWNRLPYDAVTTTGDPGALDALRAAAAATTQ